MLVLGTIFLYIAFSQRQRFGSQCFICHLNYTLFVTCDIFLCVACFSLSYMFFYVLLFFICVACFTFSYMCPFLCVACFSFSYVSFFMCCLLFRAMRNSGSTFLITLLPLGLTSGPKKPFIAFQISNPKIALLLDLIKK